MSANRRARWRRMAVVAGLLFVQAAFGIVLHPAEGEPEAENWTDRPADEVIGRWASNATCVAISPNCVITTRHQGGVVGTVVHIAGGSYRVEAVWNHPVRPNPDDAAYQEVALRVARLAGANLLHYGELYTDRTEVSLGRCAVIGGYGLGRGVELRKFGMTYGYAWEEGAVTQSLQLRWCTNSIDAISLNVRSTNPLNGTLSNHDFLIADFDDPLATCAEGVVAGHDSGGGWFVRVEDQWRLAGLTWGTDNAESKEACFRSSDTPWISRPDRMYALRISSYAGWIAGVLAEVCTPPEGDINGDCRVDLHDMARLAAQWLRGDCSAANGYCQGADVDGSGAVDAGDLNRLQGGYARALD